MKEGPEHDELVCSTGYSLSRDYDINFGGQILEDVYLSEYEIQTLIELTVTRSSNPVKFSFTFQGLKRRLNIHQQKLVKALRRLITKGLVRKENENYILTQKGEQLSMQFVNRFCLQDNILKDNTSFSAHLIPTKNINLKKKFIKCLKGRWFGRFRFDGHVVNPNKSIIAYTSDDGDLSACTCLAKDGNVRLALFSKHPISKNQLELQANCFVKLLGKNLGVDFAIKSQPCTTIERPTSQAIEPVKTEKIADHLSYS